MNNLYNIQSVSASLNDKFFCLDDPNTVDDIWVNVSFVEEINSKPKCVIDGHVNSFEVRVLVDTGAESYNYVTEKALKRMNIQTAGLTKNPEINHQVANNSSLRTLGDIKLNLTLNDTVYPVDFIVVKEEMSYEIIIGWTRFIQKYEGVINAKENYIKLRKPCSMKYNVAYLTEKYDLLPFSETVIEANTRGCFESKPILLTRFEPLFNRIGVSVASSILHSHKSGEEHTIRAVLVNLTDREVQLPGNTVIAHLEQVDDSDISERFDFDPKYSQAKLTSRRTASVAHIPCEDKQLDYQDSPIHEENDIKIQNEALTDEQIKTVNQLVNVEFKDLFTKSIKGGIAIGVTHDIDTGDNHPISKPPYRVGFKEREIIDEQVLEMSKDGIIRPSKSPWSSRIVLVKRKSGKPRFCIDFRDLNKITKKDVYPLPRIDDS